MRSKEWAENSENCFKGKVKDAGIDHKANKSITNKTDLNQT